MSDLEVFYPERMASRILGMGDVLTLIEKATAEIDAEKAKQMGDRMLSKEFNFEDYLDMVSQMKKLGPMNKLLEMMPGGLGKELKGLDLSQGEKDMKKNESIINSMTLKERRNPSLISVSPSRKKRIALGSGTNIQNINKLLKDFENMKKMIKQFGGMQKKGKKGMFGKLPFMN